MYAFDERSEEPQYNSEPTRLPYNAGLNVGDYFFDMDVDQWSPTSHPSVSVFLESVKIIRNFKATPDSIKTHCRFWVEYLTVEIVALYQQRREKKIAVTVTGAVVQLEGQQVAQHVARSNLNVPKVTGNRHKKQTDPAASSSASASSALELPAPVVPAKRRLPQHLVKVSNKPASHITLDRGANPFHESPLEAQFREQERRGHKLLAAGENVMDTAKYRCEALAINKIFCLTDIKDNEEVDKLVDRMEFLNPFDLYLDDLVRVGKPLAKIIQRTQDALDITLKFDTFIGQTKLTRPQRWSIKIWQFLADTLPDQYVPGNVGEQTFQLAKLFPFLIPTFSARSKKLLGADTETEGGGEGKHQHAGGKRPDFFIFSSTFSGTHTHLVGETKPPGKAGGEAVLSDKWKLFSMMADELLLQKKLQVKVPKVFGVQVFGHQIEIWCMATSLPFANPLVCLFASNLPTSVQDLDGVPRLISAFFSLEALIKVDDDVYEELDVKEIQEGSQGKIKVSPIKVKK